MDPNNEVRGERLIEDTITNLNSRGGLLPSLGGDQRGGVGRRRGGWR
jgi:hypothetical protein